MRDWRVELALLLLVVAVSVLGVRRLTAISRIHDSTLPNALVSSTTGRSLQFVPESTIVSWSIAVATRDPFRLPQHPPDSSATAKIADTSSPRVPDLLLHGVAGGPPWSAAISVRGSESIRVVAPGDTFANTRIARIDSDVVVIEYGDTAWTLQLLRFPR